MSHTTPKLKKKPKHPRPGEKGGHKNLIRDAEEERREETNQESNN
jgi:hypothetical protein